MYRDLVTHLDSAKTVFGLQPDLSQNIAIQTNIVEIAAFYLNAVQRVQSSGPYFLGGHSFGGVVALEMAQQLKAQGEDTELLVVIDSSLDLNQKLELNSQTDLLTFLLDMGVKQKKHGKILQQLEPDEQLNYFLQHHKGAAKMLPNSDRTPLLNFLELSKLHYQAIANYQSNFYTDRVLFFKAQERDGVTAINPEQGWYKIANNQVHLHPVPGNHLTMLDSPNVVMLAQILSKYLV